MGLAPAPVPVARMELRDIRGVPRRGRPGFRGACHRAALRADPVAPSGLRVRGIVAAH